VGTSKLFSTVTDTSLVSRHRFSSALGAIFVLGHQGGGGQKGTTKVNRLREGGNARPAREITGKGESV
jgi:hypothetical protein